MSTNPLAGLASLQTPDGALLTAGAEAALRMVDAYSIDSPESFQFGNEELKSIKGKLETLDVKRRTVTDPLNQAVKAINDLFRPAVTALQTAEAVIKKKMLAYTVAERARVEEAQRAAEALAAAKRARLEEQARAAEAAGHAGQAQVMREIASVTAAAPIAATAPKASGFSVRKMKVLKITNVQAFIAHIAANPALSNLLLIDEKATLQYLTALGATLPGVEVDTVDSAASRRG